MTWQWLLPAALLVCFTQPWYPQAAPGALPTPSSSPSTWQSFGILGSVTSNSKEECLIEQIIFYFHLLKELFAYQQSPTQMWHTDMNTIKYRKNRTIYNETYIYRMEKVFILSISSCQCETSLERKYIGVSFFNKKRKMQVSICPHTETLKFKMYRFVALHRVHKS